MNLLVLAPAVLPSASEVWQKMRFFLKSAGRFEFPIRMYGIGTTPFPGYRFFKVQMALAEMEKAASEYSHILYTDSWDVLWTGPLTEVISKYHALGSPELLWAAQEQLGNCSNEEVRYPGVFDHSLHFRYPCCGGYMGELPAVIEVFRKFAVLNPEYNDDSFLVYDGIRDGWFKPVLDTGCEIFQTRAEENSDLVELDGLTRIRNRITGSFPCIWHFAGGYASHETGKEDHVRPWAEKLGLA